MKTIPAQIIPAARTLAAFLILGSLACGPVSAAPERTSRKRTQNPAASPAQPAQTSGSKDTSYNADAYRLVRTVNIFDPERRPIRTEQPVTRSETYSGPRRSYITLTGTMVETEGRSMAFFSGSQSDFSRVVSVNGKIGDFLLKGVSSTHVDLERDGKPVVLVVGKQMALDGTNITISAAPAPDETAAAGAPQAPSSTPPGESSDGAADSKPAPAAPAAGPPTDKAEILKRMMERRQKETSQ